MEYSQTIYQRVSYTFCRSSFHTVFSLSARELIRLEHFFRKCRDLKDTFQIKTTLFFKHSSGYQRLAFSQDKTSSKLFTGFAKTAERGICKRLIMNTQLHRAKAWWGCFFANVTTKNHKTNFCELFVCREKTGECDQFVAYQRFNRKRNLRK